MVMAQKLVGTSRNTADSWALLKYPCHCLGHCFFVEVRLANGRPPAVLTEADVRVVAPICARCGEAMHRQSSGAESDLYACPLNAGHEAKTFPRAADGKTLVDRISKMTALTFRLLGRRAEELKGRSASRLGSDVLG